MTADRTGKATPPKEAREGAPPPCVIRPFRSPADFHACVRLQDEVWGPGFSERVPVAILMGAQRIGGVAAGAFSSEDGGLLGFVFGMTGVEGGEPTHWSDMLAVRPEARESGLGVALKAFQRDDLLGRGIRTVRWTFDPLMAKNAYLNIRKLGAVAHEYIPEMYGDTGSPLHAGIGTDRLVALWELDSERVVARMDRADGRPDEGDASSAPPAASPVISVGWEDGHPHPSAPTLGCGDDQLLVPVPADIQALKGAAPEVAAAWRSATRGAFVHYLGNGYQVVDVFRGGAQSHYLLARRHHHRLPEQP